MYQSFSIENFRLIQQLTLEKLQRVNLIAGKNGSGKTSLLEAFFLHSGAYNPTLVINLHNFRGRENIKIELRKSAGETLWTNIFRDYNVRLPIVMDAAYDTGTKRTVQLKDLHTYEELKASGESIMPGTVSDTPSVATSDTAQILELFSEENGKTEKYRLILDTTGMKVNPPVPQPPYPCFFLGAFHRTSQKEDIHLFGRIEKIGKVEFIIKSLRIVEPRMKRLSTIVEGEEPLLYGGVGTDRLIPIADMGGGITRLLQLLLRIANASQGVVLIDEIENGFHYSILPDVFRVISEASKLFNVQIIATTHSHEAINVAHNVFSAEEGYPFRLFRLEYENGNNHVVSYDKDVLTAALQSGLEVR